MEAHQKPEEREERGFCLRLAVRLQLQLGKLWYGEEAAEVLVAHVVSPKPEREKEKRQPLKQSEEIRGLFSVLFCDLVGSRCLVFLAGFSVN